MIRAVIFDLDGTLVQTEILKANSYAEAAVLLSENKISTSEIIAEFKNVVGLSRKEVALHLMDKFNFKSSAEKRMGEFGVKTPWQAFVQIRLHFYQTFLNDTILMKNYLCPYNLNLLKTVRTKGLKTGLATMSHCEQTRRVLQILELTDFFEFIATRDDVSVGKPDPEIYRLVADELNVDPEYCLVIEDSLNGVKAALGAGMNIIVVTTDFTKKAVFNSKVIDKKWIVEDPRNLMRVAGEFLK